ncbi:MAG: trypsin-like peptidase domain-containing protein [Pirellulales bacterium]
MMCQPGRLLFSLVLCGWLGGCVLFGAAPGVAQVAVQIGKNHQRVKQRFRSVIARANQSTVRIFSSDQPWDVALGTLVGRGNYVLTTARRLHGNLRCQLVDGRQVHAQRVATIKERDVALLRLASHDLPPVVWSRGPLPPVGSLLATPGRGPDPIAIGVVSIPGSATNGWGLWHDTILRPNDCGGPVVDLTGRVVGINMVSGERVTSLALPASAVQAILEQLATDHKNLADLHVDRTDPPDRPSVDAPNGLLKFETKIRSAAKRAIACTVGLRIGHTMGSGVIISGDGYVLTAAHVSRQAGLPVKIFLADGRTAAGKTLGANRTTDAGLVQIDPPGPWPHATRAARGRAGPATAAGRWCVATGHPSGYQRGRPPVLRMGRILNAARDAIVTDCVLKQGDSGGPLFDIEGNLLGIHERIGHGLANNVHLPLRLFHTDWSRLVQGEVWGSQ